VRGAVRRLAPDLTTAMRLYLLLRRHRAALRRAGSDTRRLDELLERTADGSQVAIRGYDVLELNASRGHWIASQLLDEIVPFLERVRALEPRRVLEIGTATVATLYLLTRVAVDDAVIVSVDVRAPAFQRSARARLGRPGQRVVSIEADSHDPELRHRVETLLGHDRLDVLFIDGDHSYDGVQRDFELYAPLVRPGGLIALHDISPHPDAARSGDVPRFWAELEERHRTERLVAGEGYGIGLVYP
jgi:predicted O-methyltransferase YrrM